MKHINWKFFLPANQFFNNCAWYWNDKVFGIKIGD